MKHHFTVAKPAAFLLAGLIALGSGWPAVLAEEWPAESVSDAEGRIYKQVRKQDGGLEVWQFVGIFGSPEEALQLVGLSEEGRKGRTEIGGVPYQYELKKKDGGKKPGTGVTKSGAKDGTKKNKKAGWRSRKLRKKLPVKEIDWDSNQIFLQENRDSGR